MSGKSEKDSKRNMQQEAAGTGGKSSAGAQEKKRAKKQYKKNFTGLLFGEFLTSEVLRKNIGFILLVAFCMLLYIGNGYSSQQELIELNKLKEEVEDVKYNALIRSTVTKLLPQPAQRWMVLPPASQVAGMTVAS